MPKIINVERKGQPRQGMRGLWIVDADKLAGRVASLPTHDQINLPVQEQLIVELYSK